MSKWAQLLSLCAIVALVASHSLPQNRNNGNREARYFGYRITSTEVIPKMITSWIPSSCVQIEPSLPPCRNVRNLEEFPTFLRGYRQIDVNKEILSTIHTTPLGWGEYFGIFAPTVTVTAVELHTETVLDPKTVVTFSVKGCKPSRLPMDLSLCSVRHELEIKPTSSAAIIPNSMTFVSPGKPINLDTNEGLPSGQEVPSNNLDASHSDPISMLHPVNQFGTQPLP